MYQMKRFIDIEGHLCLCFCHYQTGLCSVSDIADEYSYYNFFTMMKDLATSFSRVIIIQDFKTVTFNVYLYTNQPSLLSSTE